MHTYKYTHTTSRLDPNIDLKLYYCGTEDCTPGHSWGPALKDHYKIHFIHKGKGTFRVGSKLYSMSQGQGFLISPHVISSYIADQEDPWSYSWVAFNGMNAELYLSRAQLSNDHPIIHCVDLDEAQSSFQHMFEASTMKKSRDLRLLSALYQFLALLIDETALELSPVSVKHQQEIYVNTAIEFVENNYSRYVTIAELADFVSLDRKYLSKLFKDETGLSPQQFLIQYRMAKACQLMLNPTLSIGEISHSVGYKDQLLFSKMFKKLKGISPKSYRESEVFTEGNSPLSN